METDSDCDVGWLAPEKQTGSTHGVLQTALIKAIGADGEDDDAAAVTTVTFLTGGSLEPQLIKILCSLDYLSSDEPGLTPKNHTIFLNLFLILLSISRS